MNTLMKTMVLAISTAVISVSALAAPQSQPSQQIHPSQQKAFQQHKQPVHKAAQSKKHDQPTQKWKVGAKIPTQYQGSHYKFNANQNKQLTKANKNQQWIKVKGDYFLIDNKTQHIIKIVRG